MEWIIVGGIWFWIITSIAFLLLIWFVNCEKVGTSVITILAYLGLIHFLGNASVFSFIKAHPAYLYIGVPAFFLLGTLWSVIKWWFYVKRKALEYREERMLWLESHNVVGATLETQVPEELRSVWMPYTRNLKPVARENKGKIISWMAFWPFSVVWTLLDEPWRIIYDAMAKLYQRISDRVFVDIEKDLVQSKKK